MLQDTLLLSGHMCSRCRPAQTGGRGRCRSLLRPTGSARAPQPPLLRLPQRPQPRQSPARREGPAPAGPAPTYSCGAFSAAGSWGRPGLRSCAGPGTTAAPRPPERPTLCPDPRHGPARPGEVPPQLRLWLRLPLPARRPGRGLEESRPLPEREGGREGALSGWAALAHTHSLCTAQGFGPRANSHPGRDCCWSRSHTPAALVAVPGGAFKTRFTCLRPIVNPRHGLRVLQFAAASAGGRKGTRGK